MAYLTAGEIVFDDLPEYLETETETITDDLTWSDDWQPELS